MNKSERTNKEWARCDGYLLPYLYVVSLTRYLLGTVHHLDCWVRNQSRGNGNKGQVLGILSGKFTHRQLASHAHICHHRSHRPPNSSRRNVTLDSLPIDCLHKETTMSNRCRTRHTCSYSKLNALKWIREQTRRCS